MNLIKPYLAAHDDSLAVGELGILDCDVPEVDFSLRLDRVKIVNVIVNVIVNDNVKIPFLPQCYVRVETVWHVALGSIVLQLGPAKTGKNTL